MVQLTGNVELLIGTISHALLPQPIFGNTRTTNLMLLAKETVTGKRIIAKPTEWQTDKEAITITFRGLSEVLVSALESILETHIGELITLKDHYDNVWSGVIMSFNALTDSGNGDYTIELIFKGSV